MSAGRILTPRLPVKSRPMSHDPSLLSPLGKATEYRADYAPELLFPIPRQIKGGHKLRTMALKDSMSVNLTARIPRREIIQHGRGAETSRLLYFPIGAARPPHSRQNHGQSRQGKAKPCRPFQIDFGKTKRFERDIAGQRRAGDEPQSRQRAQG